MQAWTRSYPELPEVSYDFSKSDFLYARWKERHLVPDHKQNILGASFAGFYCELLLFSKLSIDVGYQKSTGTITGWYYHKNSELYVASRSPLTTEIKD